MGQEQNSSNNPQQTQPKPTQAAANPSSPSAKPNAGTQQTQQANGKLDTWEQNADHDADESLQQQPLKTKLKEAFGRLSEDEISLYDNQKDKFFDKLQDKYGLAREEAEDRISEIEANQKAA